MRIDWWTLALQTANVLILIWLLGRFLFRPVDRGSSPGRGKQAHRRCGGIQRQADDARADLEQARANIAAGRDKVIAEAHGC
jgi:F-type H+-transporting ATPase subunit b